MAGKTTWSARDAAHHDRELVVELVDEFAAAGGYVDTVLRDLAQQQRDAGGVLTGFRSLAKKCGIDREECQRIVERGAEIGQYDDLEVDEDGRRFTLRISGWEADQARAGAAWKKARQREGQGGDAGGTTGGHVPGESPSGSPTRPDQTIEEPLRTSSVEMLCDLLADLIEGNGSRRPTVSERWRTETRLMLERDGRRVEDIEAVMRWCQANEFWRPNVMSMSKLREKFDQLRLKMEQESARSAPRNGGQSNTPGGPDALVPWLVDRGLPESWALQAWQLQRLGQLDEEKLRHKVEADAEEAAA